MTDIKFLIFGGPDSGKTNFGSQLLTRLEDGAGRLRLRHFPDSAKVFWDAKLAIADGKAAKHTSVETYDVQPFTLEDRISNKTAALEWADYGGEQVSVGIVQSRRVTPDWQKRLRGAAGWLLILRLTNIELRHTIFSHPIAEMPGEPSEKVPNSEEPAIASDDKATGEGDIRSRDSRLNEESDYVELLQILSYAAHRLERKRVDPLIVLLTCWDELELAEGVTPWAALMDRAPMLARYIEENWPNAHERVYGVSALGKTLSPLKVDKDTRKKGPLGIGYTILPGGERSTDLTLPIAAMLEALG